jgi:hypothetical protein
MRPIGGSEHFAFGTLLDDHLERCGLGGGDLVAGDVDLGAQLVEALTAVVTPLSTSAWPRSSSVPGIGRQC